MTLIFFALFFFVLGACVGRLSCLLMHTDIQQVPRWMLRIGLLMGIIWMLFGTLFVSVGFPTTLISIHLILLSCLVILAVEDIRTLVIPDRLTLPMIVIAFMAISYARLYHNPDLLPLVRWSLLGGLVGMVFYSLQMVTPAIIHEVKHKHFSHIPGIILTPFFFPFWILIKIFFGEKVADNIMPSMSRIATLPTWVSGGDIRLGILVGMIMGPVYFFWAVGIGYCVGALIFLIVDLFTKKHQEEIPVAPLLLIGVCGTWLMLLVTNSPVMGF